MGWKQLFDAAAAGNLEAIRALDIPLATRSPTGSSVLHAAATHLGLPLMRGLLRDSGLAVDVRDDDGVTALHQASRLGCPEVIEVLVELGADPDALDSKGQSPLDVSVHAQEPLTVNELLERGAKVCAPSTLLFAGERGSVLALQRLVPTQPKATTAEGRTLLHLVASTPAAALVAPLVAAGVALEAPDIAGWTALHCAAAQAPLPVLNALLAAGANAKARDGEGRTALHRLGAQATKEHVDALLAAGAELEAKDAHGFTPFELALEFELHPACELLGPRWEPPPGALAEPGWSLVHYAASLGSKSAVDALRDARRLAEPSEDGFAVLHQAAAFGCVQAIDLLLQAGAPVNFTAPDGSTALRFAANAEVARRLKGWGAT